MNSRRDFLGKAAAVAAASCISAKSKPLWAEVSKEVSSTRGWITTPEKKFSQITLEPWRGASSSADIVIDPTRQFQSIVGFGGAFTDSSCYLLSQMEKQKRDALLQELLGPGGLRLSMGRTCIGASDYSRTLYSFDESPTPDPELKTFSIAHDRAYILPMLIAAQQVNPEMYYFSAPWSPPGWMKANGSMLGGSMRKKYFAAYADYFVKFIQDYRSAGIKIRAVTSQNEVDTDQDGRMPAALWGQEYEIGFIKEFLGPAFRRASIDTRIWILDHNYNLWGRAMDELEDPGVRKYVDGVAWHGYMGQPSVMTRVHNAYPSKHAYWTEGGPDISSPAYATDWAKWTSTFAQILRNWARCIVSWNLVLDEKGDPNLGPFHCGGLVTCNSKTHEITRSGQYWAFAHYSKVVHRGARVIASTGDVSGTEHVAFLNPDGSHVLVISNQGRERRLSIGFAGKAMNLDVPADSAFTMVWS
ncbi:MAG TPA: glycoside hydrolase family 30 beta sandwich domain-containing protein [Candidatus Angelobacter sp.]|nr:glycoside hydrolase family 30 beta sandwich domain-containing protein [Candidatus Angelobacter sp.]